MIAGADLAHVDVMDNHFVPNLTWGLPVVQACVDAGILPVDAHLMIEDPDRWAPAYAAAGAESVTFHAEAAKAPVRLAPELRAHPARAPDPLALQEAIDTLQRKPSCGACRAELRALLWPLLAPPPAAVPRRAAADAQGRRYLDALQHDAPDAKASR